MLRPGLLVAGARGLGRGHDDHVLGLARGRGVPVCTTADAGAGYEAFIRGTDEAGFFAQQICVARDIHRSAARRIHPLVFIK